MTDKNILKDAILKDAILKDEILKDADLEQVAGGSWIESYGGDLKNAYERKIPGFEKMDPMKPDVAIYCLQNWTDGDNVVGKLKTMFAGYGIEMTYNGKPFDPNTYTYKGKQITRDEAWKIIDGGK